MSRLNSRGFTLIELMVVMVLVGVISTAAYTFFNTSLTQFFGLQKEGMVFGDLASQSQRIAKVLRGTTDILTATNDEIKVYAYFSPNDAYTSQIRYYKSVNGKIMYAEVIPMTSNPPIGTPITAQTKTYTIIPEFYTGPGVKTFEYLDSSGGTMTLPVSDLHTIKGIRVTLAVPVDSLTNGGNDTMSLEVALRNRKTNL